MKDRAGSEYEGRFRIAILVVVVGYMVLIGRLAWLQVVKGDYYLKLTSINHVSKERIPPLRGNISDRYGEILAKDIPIFDLRVIPRYMSKEPAKEIDLLVELGILEPSKAQKLLSRILKVKGLKRFRPITVKKGLIGPICPFDGTKLVERPSGGLYCPKCKRRFKDELSVVNANLSTLPGFSIRTRIKRLYPHTDGVVHVVGYVNEVNKRDLERMGNLYSKGDLIGRTGVERAFEKQLRGKPGMRFFVRTAGGHRLDPASLPPPFNTYRDIPSIPGSDITLTIDWDLTRAARQAMRYHFSGAVVAMDVHTGEILVMYSKPGFNPNLGHFGVKKTKDFDPSLYSPMLNKALMAYPPGSTFKMITSVAALTEGVIDPETKLFCAGDYIYRGHRFGCHAKYGHGDVDLIKALEVSCDVYYYQVGDALGMDTLAHYARDYFGLGQHTGVEIPERVGLVPTVRWHERHSPSGFLPGFVLNTSVGQGALKVTPLQLARAYSAFVNGGYLMRAALIRRIVSRSGKVIYQFKPRVQRYLALSDLVVASIREGLYMVVNGPHGTARKSQIKSIPFAGKTGTAQAMEWRKGGDKRFRAWLKQDHAWFAGYAPAANPQIVVVAFVEHGGGGGKAAAPVVKKVIQAYYKFYPEKVGM